MSSYPTQNDVANSSPFGVSDEQIIERLQNGDESALTLLYERYYSLFRGLVAGIVQDAVDIDQVVREGLYEIWQRSTLYNPDQGSALNWIATLICRRAIEATPRKLAYNPVRKRMGEEYPATRRQRTLREHCKTARLAFNRVKSQRHNIRAR